MCIQHTLDEFFHLVFLLLNTYFNSHMRYSNIFLLNNIKLCLFDSEKRFRNGHTAPPIFKSERIDGAGMQNSLRRRCYLWLECDARVVYSQSQARPWRDRPMGLWCCLWPECDGGFVYSWSQARPRRDTIM